MRHYTLTCLVVATASSAHAQQTWTVAAGGGAQFRDIATAVAAASDGDVLLVGPGAYDPFVIDGKGLVVVGSSSFVSNPGFPALATPAPIAIKNLAAHQHVHLSGMQVFTLGAPPANLLVQDCLGTVWLENLFCDSYGAPALRVERCAAVMLADCFLQTNLMVALPNGMPAPGPGAQFIDSRVHAYGSQFRGSHGTLQGPAFPVPNAPADGGNGLEVVDSSVELQGGEIAAGGGNSLFVGNCSFGGNGGDGVVLRTNGGVAPELRLRDVVVNHGFPSPFTCGSTPVPGVVSRVLAGQIVMLAGGARSLRGSGSFVAPSMVMLEVRGAPGDAAFLFASLPVSAVAVLGVSVHVSAPLIALGFAVAGPTGRADFPLVLPSLPPGAPTFTGALQAAVLGNGGALFATGPATIVVR